MDGWSVVWPEALNNVWIDAPFSGDAVKFDRGWMRKLRKNRDNVCHYG